MTTPGIKVWDRFIRIFHWTLVIAFVVSYLTEGENYLHFYSGWYIALLLGLRFIWGFAGSQYARFSDFIKPPTEILHYAKSMFSESHAPKRYVGHNPLGGIMVVALMVFLSLTCLSGVLLYTSDGKALWSFLGEAPLQSFSEHEETRANMLAPGQPASISAIQSTDQDDDDEESEHHDSTSHQSAMEHEDDESEEVLEELHEWFANITLWLILLHIAGVVVSSRIHKENLVRAMITGKK